MSLRRLALLLVFLMIAINVVIAATGNMHAGGHHPAWVNSLSWLFTAALVGLIVVAVVALRRRRHRSLRGHS
jgi:cytochrome bd-type quinol oxidase subunit 2